MGLITFNILLLGEATAQDEFLSSLLTFAPWPDASTLDLRAILPVLADDSLPPSRSSLLLHVARGAPPASSPPPATSAALLAYTAACPLAALEAQLAWLAPSRVPVVLLRAGPADGGGGGGGAVAPAAAALAPAFPSIGASLDLSGGDSEGALRALRACVDAAAAPLWPLLCARGGGVFTADGERALAALFDGADGEGRGWLGALELAALLGGARAPAEEAAVAALEGLRGVPGAVCNVGGAPPLVGDALYATPAGLRAALLAALLGGEARTVWRLLARAGYRCEAAGGGCGGGALGDAQLRRALRLEGGVPPRAPPPRRQCRAGAGGGGGPCVCGGGAGALPPPLAREACAVQTDDPWRGPREWGALALSGTAAAGACYNRGCAAGAVLRALPPRCALRFVAALFRRYASGSPRALSGACVRALLARAAVLRGRVGGGPARARTRWFVAAAGAGGALSLPAWISFWSALASTAPHTACCALAALGYGAGGDGDARAPPLEASPARRGSGAAPPPRVVRVLLAGAPLGGKTQLAEAMLAASAHGEGGGGPTWVIAGGDGEGALQHRPPAQPLGPLLEEEEEEEEEPTREEEGGGSACEEEWEPATADGGDAGAPTLTHYAMAVPSAGDGDARARPWTLVLTEAQGSGPVGAARAAAAPGIDGVLLCVDAESAAAVSWFAKAVEALPPGTPAAAVVTRGGRWMGFLAELCGPPAAGVLPLDERLRDAWGRLKDGSTCSGWEAWAGGFDAGGGGGGAPSAPPPPTHVHPFCIPLIDASGAGGAGAALEAAVALAAGGAPPARSAAQRTAEAAARASRRRVRAAAALAALVLAAGVALASSSAARGAVACFAARCAAALRKRLRFGRR
jgi:hypothetical protein